ncbi:flavodoxin family protein [Parvularcula sp. LCG005]|uniref:flavodoxin family protein n=1 Tax=Parvularcula sp. LCG005 TaxID=3078805 RepID=UPI00294384A6|nr:flavodoxin family protein [Parvularcula sp. LCG005]WOI52274.1 flavodoxin family protein [Parvularcula sp. LCG005]
MTKVAIVYHSGFGHTKLQAEAVEQGAASVDGVETLLVPAEDAAGNLDQFADADAIIFGAPTYMGSASAGMKTFMDATSKVWFSQGWKDKIAGGFTNSHSLSGDKVNTLFQFVVLAAQHGMIWVGQGEPNGSDEAGQAGHPDAVNRIGGYLGAMAQSENAPAEEGNPPAGDIKTAFHYGARIAKIAKRFGAAH